jgi:hypothetical protein
MILSFQYKFVVLIKIQLNLFDVASFFNFKSCQGGRTHTVYVNGKYENKTKILPVQNVEINKKVHLSDDRLFLKSNCLLLEIIHLIYFVFINKYFYFN